MNVVRFIHILFVLYFVILPFVTNKPTSLLMHLIFGFGIIVHWALNSDVCALTILENKLFGTPISDTFTNRLIGSVYRITNTQIKLITYILCLVSATKLFYSWSQSDEKFFTWLYS